MNIAWFVGFSKFHAGKWGKIWKKQCKIFHLKFLNINLISVGGFRQRIAILLRLKYDSNSKSEKSKKCDPILKK
jgi:hypothetical protein